MDANSSDVTHDHRGARYLLGHTTDHYAIWDSTATAEPLETFPLTDEAWEKAWDRFSSLEMDHDSSDVAHDHQGPRFVLGHTSVNYAIWDSTASTEPLETFPLTDEGWKRAWDRFSTLEAEPISTSEAEPTSTLDAEPTSTLAAAPSPRRPSNQKRVVLAVGGIAAVVGAIVLVTMLGGDDVAPDGGGDGRTPEPTRFDELLSHVPSTFRASCTENDPLPGAVVGAHCQDGPVFVEYHGYEDFDAMYADYFDFAGGLPSGDCEFDVEAEHRYRDGRVACFNVEDSTEIDWTDNQLLIYAFAWRNDSNGGALYAWWEAAGGPS